jgi:hypothetical protein
MHFTLVPFYIRPVWPSGKVIRPLAADSCHHLKNQRAKLIDNMKLQVVTLQTLLEMKNELENLGKFLINIEIATRK